MDLLFIVDNVLLALLYLTLYQILKQKNQPVMMVTILLGLLGIALIVTTLVMRNSIFGNRTATVGLISGLLMVIPSTAWIVGLVCSLFSLIPWMIFLIKMVRTFRKLSCS